MILTLRILIALIGPILAGWLFVRAVCPEVPNGLRLALGAGLGTGLTGAVYFLTLVITDSAVCSLAASEVFLYGGILILALRRGTRSTAPKVHRRVDDAGGGLETALCWTLRVMLVLGCVALFYLLDRYPHGEWDGIAIWNTKARFIALSPEQPLKRLSDPALWDTQVDYPLLLPSIVARGFQYAGKASTAVPQMVSVLFAASTFLMLLSGLKLVSSTSQAHLAGCLLLGMPSFLSNAAYQYADIPIGYFITASLMLFSINDMFGPSDWKRAFLGSVAAGLAACTKNEGLLFVLVLVAVRLFLTLWRKTLRADLPALAGLAAGVATCLGIVIAFKSMLAPPDPMISEITTEKVVARLSDVDYQLKLIGRLGSVLVRFGSWWVIPTPLLVGHLAASRKRIALGRGTAPWLTAALVLAGILAGDYVIYLLTPYDLQWHVDSSFSRLLLQVYPAMLVLYSMLVAPRITIERVGFARRTKIFATATLIGCALFAAIFIWVSRPSEPKSPQLMLSKHQVVAGADSYVLTIKEMPNASVIFRYTLNGEEPSWASLKLDAHGQSRIDVPASTKKGVYRFLAFRRSDGADWTKTDITITVK